jgi:PEP-CTERM motif
MLRSMSRLALIFAAVVLIGQTQSASAQVILYSTNFNAPTYVDGPLNTNIDTITPGQDGWLNTSGGGTNNISVSNSASNGFVSLTTNGQDVRHLFNVGPITSTSVFFDADITVTAAQATGDYALHFSDGGTSLFYGRTYIRSSGSGFVMALGTSSGTAVNYGATELVFGQTYHILTRYDFVAGTGNDTGALFINPTTMDGSGDTPYVLATTIGLDAASINAIALRQGGATNSATLTVDNFRAFSPVPEPSSLALAGLAGAALWFRRRRKPVAA